MNNPKPTYYAILTADVRYSTKINASEKLLFAEITALSQKDGTCWASNRYFADLYDVSKETVSRWVASLARESFITMRYTYKDGTKEIDKRYMQIYQGGIDKNIKGGIDENVKVNSTSFNTINTNKAFDEFWSNYPKKDGKKTAFSAFKRLSKKNQIKATEDCKTRYNGRERQYIKNPSTYLNQESWNDERLDNNTATFRNVL